MSDYSNTIIYKIYCKDTTIEFVYIGLTIDFTNRKRKHQENCSNMLSTEYIYKFINSHGGWCNWDMVELATYNCKDYNEASIYEKKHIESFEYVLNKHSITLQQKEKQPLLDTSIIKLGILKTREYNNKELTCECGLTYRNSNKHNHLSSIKHQYRMEAINWLVSNPNILQNYIKNGIPI